MGRGAPALAGIARTADSGGATRASSVGPETAGLEQVCAHERKYTRELAAGASAWHRA